MMSVNIWALIDFVARIGPSAAYEELILPCEERGDMALSFAAELASDKQIYTWRVISR